MHPGYQIESVYICRTPVDFRKFNVPGNEKRMDQFYREVRRHWMHALRRRSQRHRMTWERLTAIARRYLPYPRQVPKHPYPVIRFGVII